MKIMLDCSPAKILEYRERYAEDFWQLRTPLTGYARAKDIPYGLDNGMFKGVLHVDRWDRILEEAEHDRPVFVAVPDIVGDAARTLELFEHFRRKIPHDLPLALVAQNGIERERVPWDNVDAIFIGGDTPFKSSKEALAIARTAKILGKWVHVGRVNTWARARNWLDISDSFDGSGMSQFDHMLEDVLAIKRGEHPHLELQL